MNRTLKKKQWNAAGILPSWSVRDLSRGLRNKCFLVGTKREIPKEHGGLFCLFRQNRSQTEPKCQK